MHDFHIYFISIQFHEMFSITNLLCPCVRIKAFIYQGNIFISMYMVSGTHLICISIWKSESGPSLQSLNLMATIGYTLAPLLCKPFISSAGADGHLETNTSVIPLQPMVNESLDSADSYYVRNMSISDPREDNSKIQYAYMIVAIYDLVIGILLMILFVKDGCKTKGSKTEDNP